MKKGNPNLPNPPQKIKDDLVIAIDGYSSCGKSTLAKDMAAALNYRFIDSGAMYRSVALYFIENNIIVEEDKDYSTLLNTKVKIHFERINGKNTTFLNDQNVEDEIRAQKVANIVSNVAKNGSIRSYLVDLQRVMGEKGGVIMDGRDIGTVVFPNADVKLFITADVEIRAARRYKEMTEKGKIITLLEVKANLQSRDQIDSTRAISPLRRAEDAILLDTSHHTRKSQLQEAIEHVLSLG